MKLQQHDNFLISNQLISDNNNSVHNPVHNPTNSEFLSLYPQISNNSSSQKTNTHPFLLINICKKDDSLMQTQLNQIQNDTTIQKVNITSNINSKINNCINGLTKSNDDLIYENNSKCRQDIGINLTNEKTNENTNKKKPKFKNKFKICHTEFQQIPNEKTTSISKINHKRKYKSDDIRKKIKARFHKSLKNIINENLRKAGSKKLFTFLPQAFISSVSREKNREVLNLSYRELLQKNFVNEEDKKKCKIIRRDDLYKYKRNLSVLEYLDKNPSICYNSGFDIISKMKYCDLLNEYFNSEEFKKAIIKLREEEEDEDYIKEYIHKSQNYVKFFTSNLNNKSK
jgi:hypothetical protein